MRTTTAIISGALLSCLLAAPALGTELLGIRSGCIALEAAAQPAQPAQPARPAQPAQPAVPGAEKGEFPATSTVNIVFTATLVPSREVDTPKTAVLSIFTPKGFLYQEIDVPIGRSSGEGKEEKSRLLPGYQNSLPVVHPVPDPRPGSGRRGVLLSLPPLLVGGTSIQQGGLYGTWKAEFRASDGSSPCSVSFRITP